MLLWKHMNMLQRLFFKHRSDATDLRPDSLPWIDAVDVESIKDSLIALNKKHIRVFEWGPGGSTLYFSRFLRERGMTYEWSAVENNKKWHANLLKLTGNDKNINMALYPFSRFLPGAFKNRRLYADHPKSLGGKFDFILVDGRERSKCLKLARELINDGGVIFLHDAERGRYQKAMALYPSGRIVSPSGQKKRLLWRASA